MAKSVRIKRLEVELADLVDKTEKLQRYVSGLPRGARPVHIRQLGYMLSYADCLRYRIETEKD